MVDWKEDPYLYRGRGLLNVVRPMGRGATGSERFRVGEHPLPAAPPSQWSHYLKQTLFLV